ncbi:MAG: hypothetical protein AMDU1_APLC00096G0002 [Thermoplasmatales archaeon A-plasma]|jgi:hypothetical protein|nr:MAG: hypothetical protein AMDU1_APLC00096G0002 [Thermoplasmatales archaeon A-plasma]WMT44181.1 MAG: hypothetical protein RE469_08230 [Cuniculiplasma divulgatum]
MRSILESVNPMMKKVPVNVRKKQPFRKNTEEILEIDTHNLGHTGSRMVKDYRELYLK